MERIHSKDGTTIAFDQLGSGPVLVLIAGGSCDRAISTPIAEAMAGDFTVLNHDRRGRGDSGDTLPYAVEREVEDIEALIAAGGGRASLLGFSSGAALAAEAVASGLPVDSLIMWEPPFGVDADDARRASEYTERLTELLAAGRRGDALVHFMTRVGLPEEAIDGIRHSPYWPIGESMAPTLAYDATILGDTMVPAARFARIDVPTMVLAGTASPEAMRTGARAAAAAIPSAHYEELVGEDHNVSAEAIAPVAVRFAGAGSRPGGTRRRA